MSVNFEIAKRKTVEVLTNNNVILGDKACLMTLPSISMPTGKKTVKKKELTLYDGRVITSNKVSGGAIEWFPQDQLSDFGTLRKQAYKCFDELAIDLGGNYLISLDNLDKVQSELTRIETEWQAKVEYLDKNFEAVLSKYRSENSDIESIITDYSIPKGEFISVFKFNVLPAMAVQPVIPDSVDKIAKTAIENLWSEIAKEAARQYNTSFNEGENVSQKAVTALVRIRDKLTSMSFLREGIDYVVETFDSMMNRLPKNGKIEGNDFHELGHFVLQLSDENRLKATADKDFQNGINIAAFYKPQISSEQSDEVADVEFEAVDTPNVDNEFGNPQDAMQESSLEDDVELPNLELVQADLDWNNF